MMHLCRALAAVHPRRTESGVKGWPWVLLGLTTWACRTALLWHFVKDIPKGLEMSLTVSTKGSRHEREDKLHRITLLGASHMACGAEEQIKALGPILKRLSRRRLLIQDECRRAVQNCGRWTGRLTVGWNVAHVKRGLFSIAQSQRKRSGKSSKRPWPDVNRCGSQSFTSKGVRA